MSLPPPPIPDPPSIPPPPELRPPDDDTRPSRTPLVVGVLLAVLLLGGGGLLWSWANQPSICHDASVTSERFGYCITVPEGWRVADVGDDLPADQLFRPDGATTLMIQAVDTQRDLRAFAEDVRGLQTDDGLKVEQIRTLTVAGVDALRWDATLGASGDITTRTIVFARDGIAWRLQFADVTDAFDESVADLDRMLGSWRFR